MHHANTLPKVHAQQIIRPGILKTICEEIGDAARYGSHSTTYRWKLTLAEQQYLALYGYRTNEAIDSFEQTVTVVRY